MNDQSPRQEPDQAPDETEADETEAPAIEQQDWDAIKSGEIVPQSVPDNGDIAYAPSTIERSGDLLPEEDDDNAYQESDDALPDDEEEAALTRNPSKEGSLFDEV